jgi:glyoxylase-like metal-dependent hydrolase (beta-lactamase superfamily II)
LAAHNPSRETSGDAGRLGSPGDREGSSIRDVAAIELRRVKAHLVLEAELSLIDCGYAGSGARIASVIEGTGRSMAELVRVVCTHGHPDHAGAARELALDGIPVLIHPADAATLATTWRDALQRPSRGRIFAAMTPEPPEVVSIEDGDILPMLGGLEVIHTPGHTPGSVCLYGRRDRVLFVGDTLQRRFGRVSYASALYSDDVTAARRAVKRLASLDVNTIVFSHYPPLQEGAMETLETLARRIE